MRNLSDEELARRATDGALESFEEILARYRHRVYRICYRSAGNAEDAEDWAQECFVRAYSQLGRYNAELPFAPWLFRVVSNTCINQAKSRERRMQNLSRECEMELEIDDVEWSREPGPLERLESAEKERLALRAIETLPPDMKIAVVLRVVEQLSFQELADVLDVPLQTAATRVRRALEKVRAQLSRDEKSEVPE